MKVSFPLIFGDSVTESIDTGSRSVREGVQRVKLVACPTLEPLPFLVRPKHKKKKRRTENTDYPEAQEFDSLTKNAKRALILRSVRRAAQVSDPVAARSLTKATMDDLASFLGFELAAEQYRWETFQELFQLLQTVAQSPEELKPFCQDFWRVVRLAKKYQWSEETLIPQSVFGPMWPEKTPAWAKRV
jgi:hypothetical protein